MKNRSGKRLAVVTMIAVIIMAMSVFAQEIEKVHSYYPAAKLKHTFKSGKTTIKAGEKVTVVKKGSSVSIIRYKKKNYKIRTSQFRIYDWCTRGSRPYNRASAEHFVNRKGYSSRTKYLIWISTYTQHLYVFKGSKGNWKMIGHHSCATGKFGHETVMGESIIGFKKPWVYFYESIGQGGYYCLRIRGGFIHSWPYNISWAQAHNGQKLIWSREHYGRPASAGCARVPIKFAKWLYDTIPVNTKAVVY